MNFHSFFCGALLVTLFAAASADEPTDTFLTKLRSAIETKDAAAMEALHNTDVATPLELERLRSGIATGFKYMAAGSPKSMKAVPLSDDYSFDVMIHNSERIEPSVKPVGMIRIEQPISTTKPLLYEGKKP